MKYILKHSLVIIFLLFCLSQTQAQQFKYSKHPNNKFHSHHLMYVNNIRITGMIGLSSYYGDLCNSTVCFKYRPGVTVGAYWRYNSRISLRGDFTYLRLSGSDKGGPNANRNLSFRSPNVEVAAGIMYDIVPFQRNYHLRAQFTPYVFAEIGLLYYNPKAQYNGKWYALRPLMTEGTKYGSFTASLPFGGGLRYKLNDVIDISFEFAYRKTFTDHLDDVSTKYVDNSSLTGIAATLADRTAEGGYKIHDSSPDGKHWAAGHQRGNPSKKDGYFLFGFKIEYMIKVTQQIHNLNSMPRFRQKHSGMHRKYR